MLAGRAVGFLLIFWPVCGVAWADAPAIPAWEKPRKDACSFDHPDKVAGSGAGPAQVLDATEKTRELHHAYALIRQRRGF